MEFLRAENKRKDTLLKQKDEEIQKQNTIIVGLEEQLRKSIDLIHDNDAPVNQKQLKIDELSEQLQVAKMEVSTNEAGFVKIDDFINRYVPLRNICSLRTDDVACPY